VARHENGQDSLGSDRTSAERGGGRRIHSPAESEDEAIGTGAGELFAQPHGDFVRKRHQCLLVVSV
jgi:hypothetical protein